MGGSGGSSQAIAPRRLRRASAVVSGAVALSTALSSTVLQAPIHDPNQHVVEISPLLRDRANLEPVRRHAPAMDNGNGTSCPNRAYAQTTSQLHTVYKPGISISPSTAYRCAISAGYSEWQSVILVAIMGQESRLEPSVYDPQPIGTNNAVGLLQLLANVQNPGGYNVHGINFVQATNPSLSLRVAHGSLGGSGPSWWVPWTGDVGSGSSNAFCRFMPTWYHDYNTSSTFYCPAGGGVDVPFLYRASPPKGYVPGKR